MIVSCFHAFVCACARGPWRVRVAGVCGRISFSQFSSAPAASPATYQISASPAGESAAQPATQLPRSEPGGKRTPAAARPSCTYHEREARRLNVRRVSSTCAESSSQCARGSGRTASSEGREKGGGASNQEVECGAREARREQLGHDAVAGGPAAHLGG